MPLHLPCCPHTSGFSFRSWKRVDQQYGLSEEEAKETVKSTLKKAIKLYFNSGLTPAEVMDLIPVKPIGENQGKSSKSIKPNCMGLFGKIKP